MFCIFFFFFNSFFFFKEKEIVRFNLYTSQMCLGYHLNPRRCLYSWLKIILYIFSSQIIFYFLYNKNNNNPKCYSRTIWYRTEVFHWIGQIETCPKRYIFGTEDIKTVHFGEKRENPNAKLWPSRFGNLAHSLTSHSGVLLLKRTLYGRWVFLPVSLIWHVEFSL